MYTIVYYIMFIIIYIYIYYNYYSISYKCHVSVSSNTGARDTHIIRVL